AVATPPHQPARPPRRSRGLDAGGPGRPRAPRARARQHAHAARWAPARALSPGRARARYPPWPDADHHRPDAREWVDPDARGGPRLARVPAHTARRGAGPAHTLEPAVAARRWCLGGHGRPRLSALVVAGRLVARPRGAGGHRV